MSSSGAQSMLRMRVSSRGSQVVIGDETRRDEMRTAPLIGEQERYRGGCCFVTIKRRSPEMLKVLLFCCFLCLVGWMPREGRGGDWSTDDSLEELSIKLV